MWPPDAITFLGELEANNDRDWFKANRTRYDEHLLGPARELAEKLAPKLGQPHFFRPYNDTRFHARPPIKEQLGVALGYGGGAGGFYFELSLDGLFVAAGMHNPASDQLERFRAAIDDPRRVRSFAKAADTAAAAGLKLGEPALKKPPRGYPADHPHLRLLQMKSMTVSQRHPLAKWLHKAECDTRIRAQLEAARPLVKWLGEHVGPTTKQGGRR